MGFFPIAPVVLQPLHGAAQPPSHTNPSDKQVQFKETPWLGPQKHQHRSVTLQKVEHGISGVLPSPKAAFLFPAFLLAWSNASSAKRVSLAHRECTGKCFKGDPMRVQTLKCCTSAPVPACWLELAQFPALRCAASSPPQCWQGSQHFAFHSLSPSSLPASTLPSLLSPR